MARHKLTDSKIRAETKVGLMHDGDGFYLRIRKTGSKAWHFVWRDKGIRREIALGQYGAGARPVSLAHARRKAEEVRGILASGGDPKTDMAERKAAIQQVTFGQIADEYIKTMSPKWRGGKTLVAFERFAKTYVASIRDAPVASLSTDDIVRVLQPLWHDKPETGRKTRERIKQVLDHAKARGLRQGDNPAEWRGHLDQILPANEKLSRGHHEALPYSELPHFYAKLIKTSGIAARALEFIILTAARSSEAREANWSEIDLAAKVWTISAGRMKSGRPHRVPLTARAIQILEQLRGESIDGLVFPGQREGRPISDMSLVKTMRALGSGNSTLHGFRSTFRDRTGNETAYPRELAEHALAHSAGDATETAYRRSDALERRRAMMQDWEKFAMGGI